MNSRVSNTLLSVRASVAAFVITPSNLSPMISFLRRDSIARFFFDPPNALVSASSYNKNDVMRLGERPRSLEGKQNIKMYMTSETDRQGETDKERQTGRDRQGLTDRD